MKRTICFLLILAMLSLCVPAYALSPGDIRVVIGEDLKEGEIARVYADFQLERGTVRELTVSNEEEHALLGNSLDTSVIGSVSCSCVCLRLLNEGSGNSVERHNISWCTDEMYKSALSTAGIEDVSVIVSAPFEVSGTAALVGIYKAYEDLSGTEISSEAKAASAKELVLTAQLANEFGSFDASLIVETLKSALEYSSTLNDTELRERIRQVADEYHVRLNDYQIDQLLSLLREMEKLDELKDKSGKILETVERLREMKEKAIELKEKAAGFRESLEKAIDTLQSAWKTASRWVRDNKDKFIELWNDIRDIFSHDEA